MGKFFQNGPQTLRGHIQDIKAENKRLKAEIKKLKLEICKWQDLHSEAEAMNQWIQIEEYDSYENPFALFGAYGTEADRDIWLTSQNPTEIEATHFILEPPPPKREQE